ncbi:MAG: protein kinase domain-containing protein [Pseudonocardia sp.]
MTANSLIGDRYRLHEQVGSGGMGVVWRATDELLNRQVAIKRIRLDGNPGELTRQRLLREARIAAQLHHPHIVSIFDAITVDDEPWLVLEYLPSESLSEVIRRGPLAPRQVAGIGAQLADALAAAHAAGVVHRDVKPSNVLVSRTGEVKLTDFGISHATGDVTLTSTGLLTGTPAYLAPEVCRGAQTEAASDVYSLGATLYTAVEGVPPFDDENDNVLYLVRLIAAGNVPPPRRAGPLTPVLLRLLDSDPAARPNAIAARELLRQVTDGPGVAPRMGDEPSAGPSHRGSFTPQVRPRSPRRRRLVAGAVAGVLAIATAIVIVAVGRGAVSDGPATTASQAAQPTTVPSLTGPIPGVDPRIADPCSLVDPVPLEAFGRSRLIVDFGTFAACRIDVNLPGGGSVIVSTQFLSRLRPDVALSGTVEIRGSVGIGRKEQSNGSCSRTILLPDRTRIFVSAELRSDAVADVCAMAEAATETALAKLATTGIGERAGLDAPGSLALLDACALLDPSPLTAAGVDRPTAQPGYGNWICEWGKPHRP